MSDSEFIGPEDFERAGRELPKRMEAALLRELTGKIEPALSAEEWKRFRERFQMYEEMGTPDMYKFEGYFGAQGVAVHNATLDDSDPRKITREKIATMRRAVVHEPYAGSSSPNPEGTAALRAFADALDSYLPPEK